MGKKILAKKMIASILYTGSVFFAIYIGIMLLDKNSFFTVKAYIIAAFGVCVPITIATYLLVTSVEERDKKSKITKVFVLLVSLFYITLLTHVLFLGYYRQFGAVNANKISITEYAKWQINYIPFKTIGNYLKLYINNSINRSIIVENIFGNLLLFAPLGILIPCVFTGVRKFRYFFIIIFCIVVGSEVMQMYTRWGSCDIDDIILNLVGAIVFYGLWSLSFVQKMLKKIYILK